MREWGHTARKCTYFKGLYPNRNMSIIEHDFYVFENRPPFCFQRSHVSLWAHTWFHSCEENVCCSDKMASRLSSLVLIHVRSAQSKHIGKYLCCFQCNIALQCIKSKTTVDKDVTQPAISALDHLAIDASTQHTASHQEVFFQGARLDHQGRPWVQVVWGVGAHLWGEAPCRQIPKRNWTLATGTGGLRRMGKPGRRKTQLGVSSAAKTADLLFSPV